MDLRNPSVFRWAGSRFSHCLILLAALGMGALLAGCVSNPSALTQATEMETPTVTPVPSTATPSPQPSPTAIPPTPTITATLPAPPPIFQAKGLRSGVEPQTYLTDVCEALRLRWDPERSEPGTIVVPIMFHSIAEPGRVIKDDTTITEQYFADIMAHAEALGFETITTAQLVDFLQNNAKIPPRSMMLILDDRRPGVTERFIPYLEKNDWTLTLAWINANNDATLWKRMEGLASTGHLDVQSHGYNHVYIVPETPLDIVREELEKPIDLIQEHFGARPLAVVWPGGNFTPTSVEMAQDDGYQVGFTAFSRGPIMFNWIPLGEPERAIQNPVMVLPRFWSTAAWVNLDEAVQIAEQAKAAAEAERPQEEAWLKQYCSPSTTTP
ncbi:MAG: polysaccharide deacetylase family protein [Anaerolineaceae bacterium]